MSEPLHFFYASAEEGKQIHAVEWLPDQSEARGVVQIVHGISEHMGSYDTFARYIAANGYIAVGEDHLGHGASATSKSDYGVFPEENGWNKIVEDVYALRKLEGSKYPGLPYCLLGHSMGSFLARTYLIDFSGTIDLTILSGTGQEKAWLIGLGKFVAGLLRRINGPHAKSRLLQRMSIGSYNRQFRPTRTTADWLSRDRDHVDSYIKGELTQISPSIGMFEDMLGGLQYIAEPANLTQMDKDIPVLFLSGAQDPVGANGEGVKKVYNMFENAGCRNLALKLYPQARHSILHETNKIEVFDDILIWLNSSGKMDLSSFLSPNF